MQLGGMHFPLYRVINGDPRHSDHRPIILECDKTVEALGWQEDQNI